MKSGTSRQNIEMQKIIAITGVSLFIIKLVAWYLTDSVAILTDALESTINVISGFIGLYSLHLSALPKDANHPYGHGKVEFISAAIEGTLICAASLFIIYEAIINLREPHEIGQLDTGILLVASTALINWLVGSYAVNKGKKNNSLALIASGKHLQADTYTTVGIIVGLILLYFTKIPWLDSVVAMLFSLFIIMTGYKILRTSVAGMMDEADENLLAQVVEKLNSERRENWIDLHNLRIIKYGGVLHLDCHLTVPWYLNVHQAHKEVESLEKLVKTHFGESVELFVHTDGCLDFSCNICTKTDCKMRKHPFINKIEWTVANISANQKHRII
ncbi:MAG TPA: cation diffusion facilitator family transporter [Saprospiraceae bacterium]|nr:cation diffusion facilitator family transporter [Saprospiraceae bacterium]HMV23745.1 cation diffusion facilitator family transporter [Saprospiraceae bacterium]HNA93962.1 cation diffusion facilitator family transporter [Saprospiraceae bacterium]HNE64181.1 cation diffusion facilitator family transporter [Saprospiraceae bacterium]HNG05724.1 cation diffusion facilitator family transporter [Saprospiraceae bacterium]